MKVLICSWRDRSHPDGGGSEVYVEQMARGLVARGHDVTLLCSKHSGAVSRQQYDGFTVLRRGGRLTVYLYGLLAVLSPRFRDAVVVDTINGLPFWTPLFARRRVVALVHHVHREQWHIIYPGLGGRLGWFIESRVVPRIYRRCRLITVSRASARDLRDLGFADQQIQIIANGSPDAPAGLPQKSVQPRVCVLSRLVPHKQIEHALRAMPALREEFPGIVLDLVGDGWWADRLDAEIHRLGIADVVRRHGSVSEPAKFALLSRAWVQVFASVKEGWGIVIMEAAVAGTPTIAYRHAGGPAEAIIDGVTGVLVDDPAALQDRLLTLLRDPGRLAEMGEQARRHATAHDWTTSLDAFETVLAEVQAQARRR